MGPRSAQRPDAIIVGGGHNGLVAASYLARAGRSVLLLEQRDTVGGAVAGGRAFDGIDARLSRYSYLVSLLPDRIVNDLDLHLDIRSRRSAAYVPVERDGCHTGLFVERDEGLPTAESFAALTGSPAEYESWQSFNAITSAVARAVAPTLLEPLPARREFARRVTDTAGDAWWEALFERPLGEIVESTFHHDVVRGVVFTDALIGTHTRAHDATLLQNRVFLYHTIGNGTGEWRVPVGGMAAVAAALECSARSAGAQILTGAKVVDVSVGEGAAEVGWVDPAGARHTAAASYVLSNVSPQTLARLRGQEPARHEEGSQLKINMVVERLPRLRSGFDPQLAFAGTFHVDEAYSQLENAYQQADGGRLPAPLPTEIYCHSLTDPSILGPEPAAAGWHTLTLFGLHSPARLFTADNETVRADAVATAFAGLNRYLAEPIEDCLARDTHGAPCVEARTPLDLQAELDLPGGNIFHGDLQWPFADETTGDDRWGVATDADALVMCGSGARRGGAVSGIGGHNAAQAVLERLGSS
ncbi:MAG: phytoene desaturase family protein [Mycobacteriales bacterium]